MTQREPSGRGLRDLVYLVPLAAGAGVGSLINRALAEQKVANRFWYRRDLGQGAADIASSANALELPSQTAVNIACILLVLAAWAVASLLTRRGGRLTDALRRQAIALAPSLSILVLTAIDASGLIPDITIFACHAVVLSLAGFAATNVYQAVATARTDGGPMQTFLDRRAAPLAAAAMCLYWVVFAAMGALQYYSMRITYTDTADWEQMLWNTLHGRFLMSSAFPHMFFGEHVQVIHLLLLPVYAVAPSLVTLMVVKSALLASGAAPVFLLARRRLSSNVVALCAAGAYLLYAPMQYTDLELEPNTFRPETFAIPAFLWAVYFLDRGRIAGFVIASVCAIACKEEMALPVAMMGLLLAARRRFAWGGAVFAASVLWFAVAVLVIIPHFRGEASHMTRYYQDFWDRDGAGQLVDTPFSGIILNMFSSPRHTLAVAFRPDKVDYLLLLLVPLGLRPLFSWRMLFVMLPSLATTLLASRMQSYNIYWHYQIVLVPFLVAGAVYGIEACTGLLTSFRFLSAGLPEQSRRKAAVLCLGALVFFSSLFGSVLYGKSPISLLFYNPAVETTYWRYQYLPDSRARRFFAEVRPLVPPDASVSATAYAATYFAARRDDFVFPEGADKADYLVVDTRDKWLRGELDLRQTSLEAILGRQDCQRVYEEDGFLVLRRTPRVAPAQPLDASK